MTDLENMRVMLLTRKIKFEEVPVEAKLGHRPAKRPGVAFDYFVEEPAQTQLKVFGGYDGFYTLLIFDEATGGLKAIEAYE